MEKVDPCLDEGMGEGGPRPVSAGIMRGPRVRSHNDSKNSEAGDFRKKRLDINVRNLSGKTKPDP